MDANALADAVLAHAGADKSPAAVPEDDGEDAHYDLVADELITAIHSKDKDSVKNLLRLLGK